MISSLICIICEIMYRNLNWYLLVCQSLEKYCFYSSSVPISLVNWIQFQIKSLFQVFVWKVSILHTAQIQDIKSNQNKISDIDTNSYCLEAINKWSKSLYIYRNSESIICHCHDDGRSRKYNKRNFQVPTIFWTDRQYSNLSIKVSLSKSKITINYLRHRAWTLNEQSRQTKNNSFYTRYHTGYNLNNLGTKFNVQPGRSGRYYHTYDLKNCVVNVSSCPRNS